MQRCLATIAAQRRKPDQVIIVDQSESPMEIGTFDGLCYVYDPTIRGAAEARNEGVRHNRCDIVLFLDDDVELLPETIENLLRAFERYPDAVGMQCPNRVRQRGERAQDLRDVIFSLGPLWKPSKRRRGVEFRNWLGGYAMAFRREIFTKVLFDESLAGYSYGEDWDMSVRAGRYGKLQVARGADVIHYFSPVNRLSSRELQRLRWRNFHYFFRKHGFYRSLSGTLVVRWWEIGEMYAWLRNGLGLPWKSGEKRGLPSTLSFWFLVTVSVRFACS